MQVSSMKDSGSPPQPVDPYTQAAAQYGLSTGTANYNARLNRTNQRNALGSSTWDITGYDSPASAPSTRMTANGANMPRLFGGFGGINGFSIPQVSPVGNAGAARTGAPIYTQTTHLAPQFESQLQKPIDTSGIAGMPGGPSTTEDLQNTRDALYREQMQFLAPEQQLQSEQTDSNLANMGATIGSPAWNNEQDRLAREQEFARSNARNQAITGGGAEQSRLFDMGGQALRNQIMARDAPISEFNALLSPSASASALTPDISGAFGQQYQGQLAGYNANVASNNATTSDITSLLAAALMFA
jgi:hypothetical protein